VRAGLHKLLLRSDGLSVKPAPTNLHWQFNNSNEPPLKNWIFFSPFPHLSHLESSVSDQRFAVVWLSRMLESGIGKTPSPANR
jgi:hypothetical protein